MVPPVPLVPLCGIRLGEPTHKGSQRMKRILLSIGMLFLAACRYNRFETRRENISAADVILVPGLELDESGQATWVLWNRMVMAKVLFDRGLAPRILVTGGKPRNGVTEAARMVEIGTQLGLPRDIFFSEPCAVSSIENGRFSADIMKRRGWKSALVVTDPRHLRYALPVFRDAFDLHGLTLYWTPVDYDLMRDLEEARHPGDDKAN